MSWKPWLCGLIVLTVLSAGAAPRLTLHVSPASAFAPATVLVQAIVEADRDNRALAVVIDSGEFYRSSLMPLEGERGPRTSVCEFRRLPSGTYEVRVAVLDSTGHERASAGEQVVILR